VERLGKVLIVDDDRDMLALLRVVLEHANYEVEEASDPEEAFDKVRSCQPDLILLDVMMPDGTEGFQLVWKLRAQGDPFLSRVPIVIHSIIHRTTELRFYPEASDGTYGPGEFLPVQGFLDKPAAPSILLKAIESGLRRVPYAS
jgi:CheY-like chemotaxis protein